MLVPIPTPLPIRGTIRGPRHGIFRAVKTRHRDGSGAIHRGLILTHKNSTNRGKLRYSASAVREEASHPQERTTRARPKSPSPLLPATQQTTTGGAMKATRRRQHGKLYAYYCYAFGLISGCDRCMSQQRDRLLMEGLLPPMSSCQMRVIAVREVKVHVP